MWNRWIKNEMGVFEISGYISNLAVSGNVAASTRNQAMNTE